MKNKNTFWTLNQHHAAGFTLVELIVVIAILAILAGVGIPAYSGYITKANKTADENLVNEIKDAIVLAYYADTEAFKEAGGAGVVVLSVDKDPEMDNSFVTDAVTKVFGEDLSGLRLKYNGWTNTHGDAIIALNNSSFSDGNGGVNESLFDTVDILTGSVANLLGQGISMNNFGRFNEYLTTNGINASTEPQKAANAAVVYLSQATDSDKRETMKNTLVNVDGWITDEGKISMGTFTDLTLVDGCDPFPSLAASYAVMKGFCIWADSQLSTGGAYSAALDSINLNEYKDYAGSSDPNPDPSPVQSESHAILAIEQGLAQITQGQETAVADLFKQYINSGTAAKDVDAYFGVIDSIADNEDYILENLDDSKSFYSDRVDYLNSYLTVTVASGDIAIIATLNPNGVPEIGAVGMNTED